MVLQLRVNSWTSPISCQGQCPWLLQRKSCYISLGTPDCQSFKDYLPRSYCILFPYVIILQRRDPPNSSCSDNLSRVSFVKAL